MIIDETGDWLTGITTYTADNKIIRIFPQPAVNTLNLTVNGITAKEVNCIVYDLSGKIVLNTNAKFAGGKANYELDISSLQNGAFILEINNQTSKIRFNVMR